MGLVYTASYHNVSVTLVQDLIELTAPSDAAVEIISAFAGQHSDAGDAEAEMLRIQITRYSTGGSGGSTVTPRPHHVGYPAAGSTIERSNTTQGGTPVPIVAQTFNVQAGWFYNPAPDERIWVSPSGIIAVEIQGAPADSIAMSCSLTFAEHGG